MTTGFWQSLSLLIWLLPMFLIYGVGSVLAAVRWAHHPKISALCLAGFACLILSLCIGGGLQVWMTSAVVDSAWNDKFSLVFSVVGAVRIVCDMAGWVFLLFAIFSGRSQTNEDPAV